MPAEPSWKEQNLGIPEWIAVVSVVVALISLAIQQHLSRQQSRFEARARQYDRTTALLFKAMDNPDLLDAISGDSGEDQRQRRFRQVWINHTMVMFGQRRLFTSAEWKSTLEDIRDFMNAPEIRTHWERYGCYYAPDFREFIDSTIYPRKGGDSVKEPPPKASEEHQASLT
ncbi:hypothetical protein HAHE_24880 [Haloferula helveola]|uniref:Uncharacterized protein n=1 Tax=Haloferula helveola TaxID=490095 RepID=A0ABM7RAU2_9BACT|nr:hypothetical protein HAHE_24880 [Haloferula helveola]